MRRTQQAAIAVAIVAAALGLAWAAVPIEPLRIWYQDGIFLGTKATNPTATAGNRLQVLCQGDVTIDLPSIAAGYCSIASTKTLTNCGGATASSTCLMTAPGTADDGGIQPWFNELRHSCYVSSVSGSSTTVALNTCKAMADGGAADPGSGSFHLTVLR